jgi:hypothetical protein
LNQAGALPNSLCPMVAKDDGDGAVMLPMLTSSRIYCLSGAGLESNLSDMTRPQARATARKRSFLGPILWIFGVPLDLTISSGFNESVPGPRRRERPAPVVDQCSVALGSR